MPALYIEEKLIPELLNMETTISLVEEAFTSYASGKAFSMARQRMRIRKGALHLLPGAVPYKNVIGYKAYTSFRNGTIFKTYLHSAETGELLAVVDSAEIGRLRTGAASGVASKYMARKNSETVFIFGTGFQAEAQLEAVCSVLPIKKVLVSSRTPANAAAFANKMSKRLNLDATPATDIQEQLGLADVIITVTTSAKPLFEHSWLTQKGVHINAAGSNALIRAEIPEKTVESAEILAVDSKEVALIECGDILPSLEKGRIHMNEIAELGDITAGLRPGRTDDEMITLFESQGMGLQDIICAEYIYQKAKETNLGITLPF